MKEISGADFMPIDGQLARILSAVNGFSCAFGSVGNFALIAVILLHKQLHGASEILLMSLAFADFLTCAVYLPLLLMRINTNEKLPTLMNQSRRAIGQAVVVCGSLNLLMLTVDRLVFFYRPLRYAYWMRKKIITTIIIIIYGISLFVGFYAYFDMIKSQYPKIGLVGVPMLGFFTLHYAIYRLARTHRNQVVNQEQSLQHNYNINSRVMIQARRNVRTVMLFGILYLVTWLPVTIFQLWRSVTNYHDPESFQKYFYLLLTIQQISASIDPYLCCYRNNKVKAVFKKLVRIRKYLKVGGLGSSACITTSLSMSDGLDSGKGNRKLSAVGKAAVVSESLENMLGAKVLRQLDDDTTNSGDNLDRIISISSSLERASPNEYESFESIYKIESLERTITRDDNLERIISISSTERASPNEYKSFANICKIRSYSFDSNVGTNLDRFSVEKSTSYSFDSNVGTNLDRFSDSLLEKSTTEKSTTEKSTTEKSTTEKSTTEKSTTEKSTTEKSTTEKSTTEKSTTEKSTIDKSTTEKSTTEKSTTEKSTTEKSTTEKSTLNLSEGLENVHKTEVLEQSHDVDLEKITHISCTENPGSDVSQHTSEVEQTVFSSDTIHCDSGKKTDSSTDVIMKQSALSEFGRSVQNINEDTNRSEKAENSGEIDSLTSDEVVSNLSKTKEFSGMEHSEEKELFEQPLEQSLEQYLGSEQTFEQSLRSEQSFQQSLGLKQSLEQSVALEKCGESQISGGVKNSSLTEEAVNEQSMVLNIPRSVDDHETTTKL
ncbi:VWA domain-containing [Paramuricea clavata]|uniref:VWA domain-containing n=1 Tax=Paramuricea clavata TaxID=317549 RepID=A0A6S7FVI1_PARCT|nr:VWA domain-containing [Paramuricea clavata]